jgi:hypothetical protein
MLGKRKILGGKIIREVSPDASKELRNYLMHEGIELGCKVGKKMAQEYLESRTMRNVVTNLMDLVDEVNNDLYATPLKVKNVSLSESADQESVVEVTETENVEDETLESIKTEPTKVE